MKYHHIAEQKGFTIIELMIATAVLAFILLLASVLMTSIGRLYQKGINQSRVQNATRTIVSDVSDNLKLSNNLVSSKDGEVHVYCAGDTRYTYVLKRMLGEGSDTDDTAKSIHVLWKDKRQGEACDPANLNAVTDGVEMVPVNSRLLEFNITPTSPHTITVAIAYGDIDLLSDTFNNLQWSTVCKGSVDGQFCAVSKLRSVSSSRINGY